jgi:adenine nucleotide transporter 17
MAKVRVQAHGSKGEVNEEGKPAKPRYNGAVDVLKKVYKSDGFVGWYQVCEANLVSLRILPGSQGMSAQIIKAVLAQALLFVSKDQFEQYALLIMLAWQRLANASPA